MIEFGMLATDRALMDQRRAWEARGVKTLALDFEAEFNLHEYGSRLCLIQVFDGTNYYIIDPFGVGPGQIKDFLEDRRVMKLFYGADSDRSLVYKQYGAKIKGLYDLKLLVDILELEHKGLDAVLAEAFGIETAHKKRFQMHNWTLRPVDREALQYALADVQHLFRLRDHLMARLVAAGKYESLVEALVRRDEDVKETVPGVLKSREFKELRSREKARFQKLFDLREATAKGLNLPPNLVIPKEQLFALAKDPGALASLRPDRKLSRQAVATLAEEIRKLYEAE